MAEIKNVDDFEIVELRDIDFQYLSGIKSITLEPEDTLTKLDDGGYEILIRATGERLELHRPHLEYASFRVRPFRRRKGVLKRGEELPVVQEVKQRDTVVDDSQGLRVRRPMPEGA